MINDLKKSSEWKVQQTRINFISKDVGEKLMVYCKNDND